MIARTEHCSLHRTNGPSLMSDEMHMATGTYGHEPLNNKSNQIRLERYSINKCEDPRDKAYSLMSLVREEDRIAIDYDKTSMEVFADVVNALLGTPKNKQSLGCAMLLGPSLQLRTDECRWYLKLGILMQVKVPRILLEQFFLAIESEGLSHICKVQCTRLPCPSQESCLSFETDDGSIWRHVTEVEWVSRMDTIDVQRYDVESAESSGTKGSATSLRRRNGLSTVERGMVRVRHPRRPLVSQLVDQYSNISDHHDRT